jgi:hypothetical protein
VEPGTISLQINQMMNFLNEGVRKCRKAKMITR